MKELVSPKQVIEWPTIVGLPDGGDEFGDGDSGVAKLYWTIWWARNAENDYTFYEQWNLQLKNGSTWGDKALA